MKNSEKTVIGLFLFFEILVLVMIAVSTFLPSVRNSVTGKEVSSREDAKRKGYGYYSDPEYTPCVTESGDCETPGTRYSISRCVPNFTNNDYGVGCMGKDGLITYDMIIEEEPCKKQCFSTSVALRDNVRSKTADNGSNIVTSVGTHQLLEKDTGIIMSDVFIGDFDISEMTYKLKTCIPDPDNYIGFKERTYTCESGTAGGIDGCVYMCGSDSTIDFSTGVSKSDANIFATIHYPFFETSDGKKVFQCNDLQDNNQVEILNHGKIVPDNTVLPDKCYSHVNFLEPPEELFSFKQNFKYTSDSRYIVKRSSEVTLAKYMNTDYILLSKEYSYVKMIVKSELMLLSRIYSRDNYINYTGYEPSENINIVCYIPLPESVFSEDDIQNNSQITMIRDASDSTSFQNIPYTKSIQVNGNQQSTIIQEKGFFFVPFDLRSIIGEGEEKPDEIFIGKGTYIYDSQSDTINIKQTRIKNNDFYIYISFDGNPYLASFQKVTVDGDGFFSLIYNSGNESFKRKETGSYVFYSAYYDPYKVTIDGVAGKETTIYLTQLAITSGLYVDSFSVTDTEQKFIDTPFSSFSDKGFYIYGTPLKGYPGNEILGIYYPLYLSKQYSSVQYIVFQFSEYAGTDFYMPSGHKNTAQDFVTDDWDNYEFLTGIGQVQLNRNELSFDDSQGNTLVISFWANPQMITGGKNYQQGGSFIRNTKTVLVNYQVSSDENSVILEVARNGDTLFSGIPLTEMLKGQLRESQDIQDFDQFGINYDFDFYPQKILQTVRDFSNFKGAYISGENGEKYFICTNEQGDPLPDGTKVKFDIGETITALVGDSNFNTDVSTVCGDILLSGQRKCTVERDEKVYQLSSGCISVNPENQYEAVEGFLENGYLIQDDNKLGCYVDGKQVSDTRCTKPFVTDYYENTKYYDSNEELIVNNGDTKLYVSLENNNGSVPGSSGWSTTATEKESYFNTGQYIGSDNIYLTSSPGNIFMNPDLLQSPITNISYSTLEDYTETASSYIDGVNLDQFKTVFNSLTPYLSKDINEEVIFTMKNSDLTNPLIEIEFDFLKNIEGKVFLEENYLNALVWYLSSYNFLDKTVGQSDNMFSDLENINFAKLGGNNTLEIFNSVTDTTLSLDGVSGKHVDLTGYHCYFIPMVAVDSATDKTQLNALFPIQWLSYIYSLYTENINNTPCKFEVVYVTDLNGDEIQFDRNVTGIPESQLFRFIDLPTLNVNASGVFGLFFPFSKSGPFQRINSITDSSFQLSFNIPEQYQTLIDHISIGKLDVYGEEILNKSKTFFNYGYTGFTMSDDMTTPSYSDGTRNIVQYSPSEERISSMEYVKLIKVTNDNKVYINQVSVSGKKIYSQGDTITFLSYIFNVVGTSPVIYVNGGKTEYQVFDYQIEPQNQTFFSDYNSGKFFSDYIRYNDTYVIPSIYTNPSNSLFYVLSETYSFDNTDNVEVVLSLTSTPTVPIPASTVSRTSVTFLENPSEYNADIPGIRNVDQFFRKLNQGKLVLSQLHSILISEGTRLTVQNIVGKADGVISYGIIDNNYETAVTGSNYIDKFSVDSMNGIQNDSVYRVDGYRFSIFNDKLSVFSLELKNYKKDISFYRDVQGIFPIGSVVYFKDYRDKIIYRNKTDNPIQFDINHISGQYWDDNGKINQTVDYKLYHDDEIFSKGDIVLYSGRLWKAQKDIGIPPKNSPTRSPPSEDASSWILDVPSGTLFSPLGYFEAALGDLSDSSSSLKNIKIEKSGTKHLFPQKTFYYNRRYCLDLTGTPDLYLASDSGILENKYNFVDDYVFQIEYYIENIQVNRTEFFQNNTGDKKYKIIMTMRRSTESLLKVSKISETTEIKYGSDQGTTEGKILFVNNSEEICSEVVSLNKKDDRNIPIRIGDYGTLGYCYKSCIKNISSGVYTTDPFSFIDLISENLVSGFFNNRLRSFSKGTYSSGTQSFISLAEEPCSEEANISERYLSPCVKKIGDSGSSFEEYSQYLYQIPTLEPEDYGLPFCTSNDDFLYSNSVFFYFVPMDIDSQNFLKYSIEFSNRIRIKNFFHYHRSGSNYTISTDSGIVKKADCSYQDLPSNIQIDTGDNQTFFTLAVFDKPILISGNINLQNGSNNIILTPEIYDMKFEFSIPDQDQSKISNFSRWWATDQNRNVISYGFIFGTGETYTQENIVKLSYIDDIQNYNPVSTEINIVANDGTILNYSLKLEKYTIEEFSISKFNSFSCTGIQVFQGVSQNVTLSVYFDGDGYMYQPGEYEFSGGSVSVSDTLYYKYDGDKCICRCYATYANYNASLVYPTDTTIKDISANDLVPLVFNRQKYGLLQLDGNGIPLQAGNNIIELENYEDTFVIENGKLTPNTVGKPFNKDIYGNYIPSVRNKKLSVISSNTSSNLIASVLEDFSIDDEGDAVTYFDGIDGQNPSQIYDNSQLEQIFFRQNKVRKSYPDSKYQCNIMLNTSEFSYTQDIYTIIMGVTGEILLQSGETSIDMKTNNSVEFYQNEKDSIPVEFLVEQNVITESITSYPNDQFLEIQYILDTFEVEREDYMNTSKFNKATDRRIIITYQTLFEGITTPSIEKISTRNSVNQNGGFSIIISTA
jgi:hypothetical protein